MFFTLILENANGDRVDMTATADRYMTAKADGLNPPPGTIGTSGCAGMGGSILESMPDFRKLPVAEREILHMILLSGKSARRCERESGSTAIAAAHRIASGSGAGSAAFRIKRTAADCDGLPRCCFQSSVFAAVQPRSAAKIIRFD